MALFERKAEPEDPIGTGDAATRALSVTAVENDFVERVYDKLAKVYDLIWGPSLHPGRLQAIQRMGIQPDERVGPALSALWRAFDRFLGHSLGARRPGLVHE